MSTRLPTPKEAKVRKSEVYRARIAAVREALVQAIEDSYGEEFTWAAQLFSDGTTDILLKELAASGWGHKYVPDSRDGDYYRIYPKRSRS